MAGKGAGNGGNKGFWDSFFDNPFGGMFDFNGDGKEDLGEQWLGYKVLEDITKEEKEKDIDILDGGLFDSDDTSDHSWRLTCEDGFESGLDPEDFETEAEYEEALENARLGDPITNYGADNFSSTMTSGASFPKAGDNQNLEAAVMEKEDKSTLGGASVAVEAGAEKLNVSTIMSKAEYKASRQGTVLSIVLSIFVTLLFSALPCAVIWAAFSSYDEKNSASWLVTLVFAGGGIAVLVLAIKACLSNISWDLKQQKAVKEKYLSSISEDEKQKRAHKFKTAKIVSLVCMLLAIVSVITAVSVEQFHLNSVYSKAEKLIDEERFEEAEATLKEIEDSNYKDTASLLLLCDAHGDYSSGRSVDAYYTMKKAHFSHQSTEAMSSIQSFKQILEQEYDRYIKNLSERGSQAYEDKIASGVPYVGMSESRIGDTSLGKPSSNVRHNVEIKNGERYTANLYDFYSGKNLIFTARCINGVVTQVWDERDDPIKPYVPDENHSTTTEPSVDGFSNPEDFYDWYWDDFFDYYDAEKYYYEHGGK